MNERIKELRRQAIDYCLDRGSQGNLSEEVSAKFAELIIKECLIVLNKRYMGDLNREDMEVLRCIEDVERHFEGTWSK
jgi:hypothetical protein